MPCQHLHMTSATDSGVAWRLAGSRSPLKRCANRHIPTGHRQQCKVRAKAKAGDSSGSSQDQQAALQHEASLREVAEQCFQDSPETKARLQRVGSAAAQVAALQAAQAEVALQMRQAAYSSPQDNRQLERQQAQAASERGSQADVVHAAEQLQAAASELMDAEAEKAKWQSSIDEAAEKVESAKAAAIAGVGGGIASLPYILAAGHPPLSTALSAVACLASCTLFGVTFRYAIRQDLQNLQLKGGVVAAFGLVRGSAQADMLQLSAANPITTDLLAQVQA